MYNYNARPSAVHVSTFSRLYCTLYTLIFTCILVCRWPHKLRTGCAGHREACVHRSGSYHTPGGSYESVVCVCGGRGMFRGSFVCVWVCLGNRVCVCVCGGHMIEDTTFL